MKYIESYRVQIKWDDGTKEWIDYVPESKRLNNYLDYLEQERFEEEEYEKELKEIEKESK